MSQRTYSKAPTPEAATDTPDSCSNETTAQLIPTHSSQPSSQSSSNVINEQLDFENRSEQVSDSSLRFRQPSGWVEDEMLEDMVSSDFVAETSALTLDLQVDQREGNYNEWLKSMGIHSGGDGNGPNKEKEETRSDREN